MRETVRNLAFLFVATGLPAVAAAQANSACPEAAPLRAEILARDYAPVLSYAPGERYFPTIPFFPAFDAPSGVSDFGAAAELPGLTKADGSVSWDSLDRVYHARVDTVRRNIDVYEPRTAAVFYRVHCLDPKEEKRLWGFLRNDHVAFERTGLRRAYEDGLNNAAFAVVEYFLYYVRDVGLQGHHHDIERIFVFLPQRLRSGQLGTEGRAAMKGGFLVVVGTGHSPTTPNNVLVLLDPHFDQLKNPSFLIELGGHSAAPDVDRDNTFQVGLDINWNLSANVWGTRDFQAISGRGFLGNYLSNMTFPRTACTSTLLTLRGLADTRTSPAQRAMPPTEKRNATDEGNPCSVVGTGPPPEPIPYELLPVAPFEKLANQAAGLQHARTRADTAARIDTTRRAVSEIGQELAGTSWRFRGFQGTGDAQVLRALDGASTWGTIEGAGNTEIWKHGDYVGSPIRVLKRLLFRPTFRGLQNVGDWASLFNASYTVASGGGVEQLQVGFLVPAFGFIAVPGVVELRAGSAWNDKLFHGSPEFSASVLYERHYRNLFSWYLRPIDFVANRGALEGRTDGHSAQFALGAGISIMPFFPFPDLKYVGPLLSNRLRVRLGLRTDIAGWRPEVSRIEIQTVLYVR